jgi:hypothetical protein
LRFWDFWNFDFGLFLKFWDVTMLHVPGVLFKINVTRVRIPKAACDCCWAFEYWC